MPIGQRRRAFAEARHRERRDKDQAPGGYGMSGERVRVPVRGLVSPAFGRTQAKDIHARGAINVSRTSRDPGPDRPQQDAPLCRDHRDLRGRVCPGDRWIKSLPSALSRVIRGYLQSRRTRRDARKYDATAGPHCGRRPQPVDRDPGWRPPIAIGIEESSSAARTGLPRTAVQEQTVAGPRRSTVSKRRVSRRGRKGPPAVGGRAICAAIPAVAQWDKVRPCLSTADLEQLVPIPHDRGARARAQRRSRQHGPSCVG